MRGKVIWRSGELYVWACAASVTVTFLILAVLIVVVALNGLGHFWPKRVAVARLAGGGAVMGEISGREQAPDGSWRLQFKKGNRDLYGNDFQWLPESEAGELDYPLEAVVLERLESGNFYGMLRALHLPSLPSPGAGTPWERLAPAREELVEQNEALDEAGDRMAATTRSMARLRGSIRKLIYQGGDENRREAQGLEKEMALLRKQFEEQNSLFSAKEAGLRRNVAIMREIGGQEISIPLSDIVRAYRPNGLTRGGKAAVYLSRLKELLIGEPREANTEGGLLPAIFGTVLLVLIMSMFCIPLGVVAAIYLREYAKEGFLVRIVRVAVYNMAGVPSIVYGVFGLGFFIYGVGGGIDQLFFPERLPTPTFGTGGILWAALTLSLLTVPVVIVATEEAIAVIPMGIREGSLSLGATRFQTLVRVLLPMATPGIMTGFILAMARAAGEVAPLMITGVVKLAPALPLDGNFPFLHLDRKFMHLGFHIFDVGFQSPNVEAAKPMVYITTLLLVLIVLMMSLSAIYLRNRMRKKIQSSAF